MVTTPLNDFPQDGLVDLSNNEEFEPNYENKCWGEVQYQTELWETVG